MREPQPINGPYNVVRLLLKPFEKKEEQKHFSIQKSPEGAVGCSCVLRNTLQSWYNLFKQQLY